MGHGILFDAFIYLSAAVIAVPLAKRWGLGSVLGYLLAGIIIGPFLLGLVGEQKDVMHFAEFGVVLMLFLVGLELRPALLWQLKGPILGTGGLQVLLTTAALTGVAHLIGLLHGRLGAGRVLVLVEASQPSLPPGTGVAEAAYRFGERGILDYLDAQRVFRAARNELIAARYELQLAVIEIERLRASH